MEWLAELADLSASGISKLGEPYLHKCDRMKTSIAGITVLVRIKSIINVNDTDKGAAVCAEVIVLKVKYFLTD